MAVGDGGFSIKPMGFDKNEVNEYISNLRKRMQEIEADKKLNNEKTMAAVKTAEEAENKIKAAEKAGADKAAELELQIKTERRNAESLLLQIDELKRKLKQKVQSAEGSGKANTQAAEKQSAEIIAKANAAAKSTVDKANATAKATIDKANATARETVEKAKKAAEEILSGVQGTQSQSSVDLNAFMDVVKGFVESVNSEFGKVSQKASEIMGAEMPAPSVQMPDFSKISAPQAKAPVAAQASESANILDELIAENREPEPELVEEIKPLDPTVPKHQILESFDLSSGETDNLDMNDIVTEVSPIDTNKHGQVDIDDSFERSLIAETVPSSVLENEIDEDMLAAVKEQEAKFAVQPTDGMKDFDMDMTDDDNTDDSTEAPDDADAMRKMLEAAEAAFGTSSAVMEEEEEPEPEPVSDSGADNPWADLQKQLEAMESSGNYGGTDSEGSAEEPAADIAEDPKAPSADDSSIWNFGDMSDGDSSDDDMSSDLFGSF